MNIKLNVNKNTFFQYLLELGYNYKIRQYEDFIGKIGKSIQEKVKTALLEDRLDETIEIIFEKDIGILFLSDISKITHIKPSYMVSEIESGIYDLYLEEDGYVIDDEVKKTYYLRNRLNSLKLSFPKNYLIKTHYKMLFQKNNSIDKKIKKIKNKTLLNITEDEQREYDKEIKREIVEINDGYGDEYTFFLKVHSFNKGTKLKIDYEKIEEYFKSVVLEKMDLDKELEDDYIILEKNSRGSKEVREYLNKKMNNIKNDEKTRLQNLLFILSHSNFRKGTNITDIIRILMNNMSSKESNSIFLYKFREGKKFTDFIDVVSKIKGFEYFKEIEEELKNVLSVSSFDLEIRDYQGEDILLTFEEMLEKGFVDNSEVFKLGEGK